MKFAAAALALLLSVGGADSYTFLPSQSVSSSGSGSRSRRAAASASTSLSMSTETPRKEIIVKKPIAKKPVISESPPKKEYLKKQRETIAKKPDYLRGAGVFKSVKTGVTQSMREQFDSDMMNDMKKSPNYMMEKDGVEFYLARDHGFCWGVERSINLAYSAVETFPDRMVHITNELIHNPMVNDRLHSKNVNFIAKDEDNNKDFSQINEGDVVMLPAFGATLDEMKELDVKGVKVVDTTCPWVAKVWNTIHTHQVRGLTSVIHGKYAHEETMATKSMAECYVCVKNLDEAEYVADFILTAVEGDGRAEEFMAKFGKAASTHFDPHKHLQRIGLANQTTMYKQETRAIGQLFQRTVMKKFGPDKINDHYYEFDTICDATQVRQDAVDLLCDMHHDSEQADLDFILVVGGFDSSNTAHLLEIPQERGVRSFHINTADCVGADNTIRHRTVSGDIVEGEKLLLDKYAGGDKLRIGVTSGASTPDKEVQDALGHIMLLNKFAVARASSPQP